MFAQIEKSDLLAMNLELTAKEFQLFVVYRMECFEGGGVCRKQIKDIAELYHFPYDNLTRINLSLIEKKWIERTPEGFVCCDAARRAELQNENESTAKNAVEKLRKTQSNRPKTAKNAVISAKTAEIAVEATAKNSVEDQNELRKTQSPTAKNAGTPIANKDLEFKELNTKTHTNARPREVKFDPVSDLLRIFPHLSDCLTDTQKTKIRTTVLPDFKVAWQITLDIYEGNYNPKKNYYAPEKVGNLLSVFDSEKRRLEKQNAKNSTNDAKPDSVERAGKSKPSNYEIKNGRDNSSFEGFDPIEAFRIS